MMKTIIEFVFEGGWIREAMIDYRAAQSTDGWETYWLMPEVKAVRPALYAYGTGKYQFISNRPGLRQQGDKSRPEYRLVHGKIDNPAHLETVVAALDDWVKKNLD